MRMQVEGNNQVGIKPVGMNIPVDPLMRTARPDEGIFIRTRLSRYAYSARGKVDRHLVTMLFVLTTR